SARCRETGHEEVGSIADARPIGREEWRAQRRGGLAARVSCRQPGTISELTANRGGSPSGRESGKPSRLPPKPGREPATADRESATPAEASGRATSGTGSAPAWCGHHDSFE